ncbi:Peroxisome biogenesis factor 2, partial [Stegodyphus mimosarum]
MTKYYVRRVDQLDAILLDDELYSLLNLHYRKAFKYFPNSLLVRFGPEIDILFKFLYGYLPLQTLRCSFGQSLFHLKYQKYPSYEDASDSKLRLFAVVSVCLPWFWNRLFRRLISLGNTTYSHKTLDASYALESKFSTFYQLLTLVNFCIFLQTSAFPTVIEITHKTCILSPTRNPLSE